MDILKLKRENYRKQMAATRLLVQRNNERFLILKIKKALSKILEKLNCRVSEDSNIFEIIDIISEKIYESWNRYDKLLQINKELIIANNLQKEEILSLKEIDRTLALEAIDDLPIEEDNFETSLFENLNEIPNKYPQKWEPHFKDIKGKKATAKSKQEIVRKIRNFKE